MDIIVLCILTVLCLDLGAVIDGVSPLLTVTTDCGDQRRTDNPTVRGRLLANIMTGVLVVSLTYILAYLTELTPSLLDPVHRIAVSGVLGGNSRHNFKLLLKWLQI